MIEIDIEEVDDKVEDERARRIVMLHGFRLELNDVFSTVASP